MLRRRVASEVPPRLGVEVGIAFAVGLAVGLAVVFTLVGGREPPVPVLTTPPGLSEPRVDTEVPVGNQHNADGAIAAATNYVVALGSCLTLDPASHHATLSAVSAADVDPAVPVRFTDPPAIEETGLLAVVGTSRLGRLDMAWSPETLLLGRDLTQGAGDWTLLGYASVGGPVPALHQAISAVPQALAATGGMGGFRDASAG